MTNLPEKLQQLIQTKADIKTAIESKGVTVGDATFSEYVNKIKEIEGKEWSVLSLPIHMTVSSVDAGVTPCLETLPV
ncbi:MAG: hypothetical protein CVT92_02440 [Bacteroidetes bacterium HGW-Bacteroidetes-1]|jgi:hypothetical protein|nr:MAG: hypothetical protein CVT92_02440 [Bacteroidetes bacterium HGW-Bacteroidetes-1]